MSILGVFHNLKSNKQLCFTPGRRGAAKLLTFGNAIALGC